MKTTFTFLCIFSTMGCIYYLYRRYDKIISILMIVLMAISLILYSFIFFHEVKNRINEDNSIIEKQINQNCSLDNQKFIQWFSRDEYPTKDIEELEPLNDFAKEPKVKFSKDKNQLEGCYYISTHKVRFVINNNTREVRFFDDNIN